MRRRTKIEILLIRTKALIPTDKLMQLHDNYVKQLKSGVVIIPAYSNAEIVNVPDDIEVIVESESEPEFMSKKFNV